MRKLFLAVMVLAVSGCVTNVNFSNCDEDQVNIIRSEIENYFELSDSQYEIENASCTGILSFSATARTTGDILFRLEKNTMISSSPSNYWECCITSEDPELFSRARNNLCDTLESKWFCPAWNESCGIEEYDNTTETRNLCKSGYYDSVDKGEYKIEIRQEHHYSWISVVNNNTMLCD